MLAPLVIDDNFHRFYTEHVARDFPPDEVPDEKGLRMLLQNRVYDGYLRVGEDGETEGYALLGRQHGFAFLFLYAVEPQLRGQGVGSAFMRELFELCADDDFIVLEVERPECAENADELAVRERRIRFYEHLGYEICRKVDYSVYHVPMWLMAKPLGRAEQPSPSELAAAMRKAYSHAKGLPLTTDLI